MFCQFFHILNYSASFDVAEDPVRFFAGDAATINTFAADTSGIFGTFTRVVQDLERTPCTTYKKPKRNSLRFCVGCTGF
jgi:hypothetical protein